MEPLVLLSLVGLAFSCEYVDSSLGMGYGTILSPILIIMGMDPLQVVPAILLSQAMGGLMASMFHQRYKNMDLRGSGEDTRIALLIGGVGLSATLVGVLVALNIPSWLLKTYIGALVFCMGAIILVGRVYHFSWSRLVGVGALSAFNKAMSGGGFGPVVTCGQIISGVDCRRSVGITTATEAPICIASFLLYLLLGGGIDPCLPLVLTIGALLATPLGPRKTSLQDPRLSLRFIGVLAVCLGTFTMAKTLIS